MISGIKDSLPEHRSRQDLRDIKDLDLNLSDKQMSLGFKNCRCSSFKWVNGIYKFIGHWKCIEKTYFIDLVCL